MAGRGSRASQAAGKAAPAEDKILVPEDNRIEVDGRTFVIGIMNIRQSIRLTRLCARVFDKGNAIAGELAKIEDETERQRAFANLDWMSILNDEEIKELLCIVLGAEDVTPKWVGDHWRLDWALEALAIWAEHNPLQSYFKSAGKLMTAAGRQMQTAKSMNGSIRTV
jgi:hypothetical protein